MLLRYFLNDFEAVPVAPVITGTSYVFTLNMRCISVGRTLYLKIFSVSLLITFLSPEIATSINIHVPFFIITDDDVRLIVRDGSEGLHFLTP